MKKVKILAALLLAASPVFAQGGKQNSLSDPEVLRVVSAISFVILFVVFILASQKRYLDHKLKNKIVDKGVSENIAASILQTNPHENRNSNIKWFLLLSGIGAGLHRKNTQPLAFIPGHHVIQYCCKFWGITFMR
jgi:ABC-type Fe3+-siderophore transport system permease subunit